MFDTDAGSGLIDRNPNKPAQPDASEMARRRRRFHAYERDKEREQKEQRQARRYYHGKQWTDEETRRLQARKQPIVTDNRIGRKIDFLVGVEQRMRRDPKAYPRNPKAEHSADTATAGLRFICDQNRWETHASNVAHDGMVTGIGVIWVGMEMGPDGPDPCIKPVAVDRFFYDPRSERPDFSDAQYLGLHLWMDADDAKARFAQHAEEIEQMMDRNSSFAGGLAVDQDRSQQWGDFEQRRVRIVEFWERKLNTQALMGTTSINAPHVAYVWFYSFFTGSVELEGGVSPYRDEFGVPDCPYVAWSPYVDERGDRYSPIRNMRSMQDEINHRRSKFLHMINVRQIYSRKGELDDIDETRRQLSRPDGIIEHNGEWGKSTGIVDQADQVKGQMELLVEAQSALENLGPNPGLIGKGGGVADQSGRAILAQRDSGMIELSPVFERLRDWKLRCYRKMWGRAKQCWTGERWIRITDDDGAPQFMGLNNYQMDATGTISAQNVVSEIDVDIILDEGPDTITMNEELLQQFSQLGEAAAGPLGKIMIELSNVPRKEMLLNMIDRATAPTPEVVQMNQRMAKLEELLKAATIDEKVASVESKRADTMAKLATAFTPKEPDMDDFGNPKGPPPTHPMQGLIPGMQAMRAFPLQYGQPTLEEISLDIEQQGQPPMPGQPPQGEMLPQGNSLAGAPPPMEPGGLPVDPAAAPGPIQ
jgi:hypothetical protein